MLGDSKQGPNIDYFGVFSLGSQLQLMNIHLVRKKRE